ncbi:hypothetical protein L596_015130 [Steinernema carpocapsae]|uniref:Cytochrome b5 n=1 Tax=Steinernema carpocapsae TaxID=34508 RepID=A0A4U5NEY9_STECR|nr:hypothetical protein L596_015130 [Steinernema carpocapsae]
MADKCPLKQMTTQEVAEHNTNKSAWIIIGNKVFDVTKFLDEHPGGCEVLLEQAGQDGTEAFEDVGHSTDARQMRDEYLVGEIVESERKQYSYDKKSWATTASDSSNSRQEGSALESLIYPSLVVAVIALVYYLFIA